MIKLLSLSAKGFKQLDIDELRFPSKGTILVVGRNEAGKSTLFEAIYFALFGEGLVPSRGVKGLPDLLGYRREKGLVRLTFSIDDTICEVTRVLKRKGAHEHKLKILAPRPETISGARAVNERIEKELNLDGDALLNSCFVEQKNLEKLENLRLEERQRSIARLLNIESFKRMEDEFKEEVRNLGEQEARTADKLELAIMLEEIPQVESEKLKVEHRLALITLLKEREELSNKVREDEGRTASFKSDIEKLQGQMGEIQEREKRLPKKMERLKNLASLKEMLQDYNSLIDGMREVKNNLSSIASEVERTRELEKRIDELNMSVKGEADQLEKKREELREVSTKAALFNNSSLLASWEVAKKSEDESALFDEEEMGIETKKKLKEKEKSNLTLMKSTEEVRRTYSFLGLAMLAILTLISVVGGALKSILMLLLAGIVMFFLTLVLYLRVYAPSEKNLTLLEQKLDEMEESLGKLQEGLVRIDGKRELVAMRGRVEVVHRLDMEKSMREHNFTVPSSLQECLGLKEMVSEKVAGLDKKEIEERMRNVSDGVVSLNSSIATKEETVRSLRTDVERRDIPSLLAQRDTLSRQMEDKRKKAKELLDVAERKAHELNTESDFTKVAEEHSRFSEEIASNRREIEKKEKTGMEIEAKSGEFKALAVAIAERINRRDEIDRILRDDSQAESLHVSMEITLKEKRDSLVGTLTHKRTKVEELKHILGVDHVEKVECEGELESIQKKIAVTNIAREIVVRARKQIEVNVLPRIEDNMERFIPLLTADRYKEVFINPSDYRIEVMDEVAGERRPKNVFSGGTRDQFSLALRLSFALATLPEERGSSPSFIFLDEPIGAFDEERRNALIELLTVGEISESFDQIFIISHFSELEDVFEYKIKMDGGKVIETNL
jgi:exonuclease SbcC